jgi:hypothetical protein
MDGCRIRISSGSGGLRYDRTASLTDPPQGFVSWPPIKGQRPVSRERPAATRRVLVSPTRLAFSVRRVCRERSGRARKFVFRQCGCSVRARASRDPVIQPALGHPLLV